MQVTVSGMYRTTYCSTVEMTQEEFDRLAQLQDDDYDAFAKEIDKLIDKADWLSDEDIEDPELEKLES